MALSIVKGRLLEDPGRAELRCVGEDPGALDRPAHCGLGRGRQGLAAAARCTDIGEFPPSARGQAASCVRAALSRPSLRLMRPAPKPPPRVQFQVTGKKRFRTSGLPAPASAGLPIAKRARSLTNQKDERLPEPPVRTVASDLARQRIIAYIAVIDDRKPRWPASPFAIWMMD